MPEIDFPATPKQAEFIASRAYINFLMGPRGEGKTTTGFFATLSHALQLDANLWPMRWAVVRDTWENLKITTLETIRREVWKYRIPTDGLDLKEPKLVRVGLRTEMGNFRPITELHFFGLDQPQDANRLQGFEGAGAWIEEPAPAADMSSGVPEDVLLAVTSLRQGSTQGVKPRVQITMNPPDQTHWTIKYRDDPDTLDQLRAKGIDVAFIEIPAGENPGVSQEYRERNRAMLEAMGRYDLIARLVEGRVGFIQLGVAVTPEYNPDTHNAKVSLPIYRRFPIMRSWDFGGNPTTVWWQITQTRRINIFRSIRGENVGCEQHIADAVIPWQAEHGVMGHDFEDIGDPNGMSPDQKNSNSTAVTAIEEMLTSRPGRAAIFTPGPVAIPERVGPIRYLLQKNNQHGVPVIQLDPEAVEMRRALGGGWHKKKSPAGMVGDIVKDEHSEHGDALGYGLGIKFPIPQLIARPRKTKMLRYAQPVGDRGWMSA